jgi:hypothetical protein
MLRVFLALGFVTLSCFVLGFFDLVFFAAVAIGFAADAAIGAPLRPFTAR